MDKEREEVEDEKVHGKIPISVSVVVLDMIALVFQGVEGLIFDFPAGAAGLDQVPDVFFGNGQIGDPTVAIGGFPLFIDHPVLEEMDRIGLWGPVEGHVVDPLVCMTFAFSIDEFKLLGLPHAGDFIDPLEQRLVIRRLCHEDKGHAVGLKGVDKRLLGVKVVPGDDDGELWVRFSDFSNDSLARVGLAVLLGVSVAVLDGLRKKRDHLPHVGMDDDGLKDLVMVAHRSLGRLGPKTVGTMDFLGGKIFGTIQCNEVFSVQEPVWIELPTALEMVQECREDTAEFLGRDPIDDLPHLGILGDGANAENIGEIVLLGAFLQSFLKGEKGGVLEKHHGEPAHQDIVQPMTHFPRLAGIMDLPEALGHGGHKARETKMFLYVH